MLLSILKIAVIKENRGDDELIILSIQLIQLRLSRSKGKRSNTSAKGLLGEKRYYILSVIQLPQHLVPSFPSKSQLMIASFPYTTANFFTPTGIKTSHSQQAFRAHIRPFPFNTHIK